MEQPMRSHCLFSIKHIGLARNSWVKKGGAGRSERYLNTE